MPATTTPRERRAHLRVAFLPHSRPRLVLSGEALDVLVIYGGGNPTGSNLYRDTWEHDGTQWTQR